MDLSPGRRLRERALAVLQRGWELALCQCRRANVPIEGGVSLKNSAGSLLWIEDAHWFLEFVDDDPIGLLARGLVGVTGTRQDLCREVLDASDSRKCKGRPFRNGPAPFRRSYRGR